MKRGRPPKLRSKILKQMAVSGQMSKTEATELCSANYADISDAIDNLAVNHFVKFEGKKLKLVGHKRHRIYKLTERGLRHLLESRLSPDVFWKAIMLLCFSASSTLTQKEFDNYYSHLERDYLGHFSVPDYILLTNLFEDILERWFQTTNIYFLSLTQIVLECLAMHGTLTLEELAEKVNAKQDDITQIIGNYSIDEKFSLRPFLSSNANKKLLERRNYYDFITHILIITKRFGNKQKYELSFFGVLLVISFIRCHHVGVAGGEDTNSRRSPLFYKDVTEKKYFDSIVQNYRDKIPFIFGKWEFLRDNLGSIMLYEKFDFLIFNNSVSNSFARSILSMGNKEFYDDFHMLAEIAAMKLLPVYMEGKTLLEESERIKPGITRDPRMTVVYQKVNNLRDILDYARFMSSLKNLRQSIKSQEDTNELCELRDIEKIERAFSNEVSLLFYLDLRTNIGISYPDLMPHPVIQHDRIILPPRTEEFYRLGGLEDRLMSVLDRDKEIKEWFSMWIGSLIRYRNYITDKMSKFYEEVIAPNKHLYSPPPPAGVLIMPHEEYDMTKVSSSIESVYDY